jgi:mono/diheme cytochrome c family protein
LSGTAPAQFAKVDPGKDIFRKGCITCHGPDGKGMAKSTIGFEPPATFPDFTGCQATSREPNGDWRAIITNGGPARGFSEIMPSFGEALSGTQIDQVIEYLRSLCRENWPRGEMNLPRALVAEKAFLEDESVLTGAVNAEGLPGFGLKAVYEKRFGSGNQIEVAIPFSFERPAPGSRWQGGVGDIALGYKRLVFANLHTGSILSVQGEALLPTGNRSRGFGTGVLYLEAFASYGQLLPKRTFFQIQSGFEVPTRPEEANRAAYWRTMFGKSFSQAGGSGRTWSPMVELLADREFETGAKTDWDIVPQFQVTLSRRQHVRANIGIRFPVTDSGPRAAQVMFYLLWDWFDGGFLDGWK